MLRLFLQFYWWLFGWKISGNFPYHYKKMVLAVAPHTHWVDVMVGFAAYPACKIPWQAGTFQMATWLDTPKNGRNTS
jgi:1-acyl-sn-glycerol-3-phosphate acyltransferase